MNRLFRVLHRWKCTTLPQKLAVDALRHVGDDAPRRAGLFLWHIEPYLRGVAAPETQFRDATNHVFYPVDNWGGAPRLARKWYWRTVESLQTRDWNEATYNAGVLARYVTFAFLPLRTGHDETAIALRAPLEWCAGRNYDTSLATAEANATVVIPTGDDWLERLVMSGAEAAHCHLKACRDRFDFDMAIKNPRLLDESLRSALNELNTRAAATVGAILSRAIEESGGELPRYPLGSAGLFSLPALPLFWLTRTRTRASEKAPIRAMHREWKATGKVDATLPDDARAVRDAYELEVLKKSPRKIEPLKQEPQPSLARQIEGVPPKPKPSPPLPGSPSPPLTVRSPLAALPSMAAKLISRLESIGVTTIGHLLDANAEDLAACLHPDATAADVAGWQDEARLCCEISSLSPAEAQLLAACGVTGSEDLAALSPVELWELVIPVAESPDGRRVLRGQPAPGLDAVTQWIDAAKKAA
ncbi:MAG: DUF4332 domain-containing protein [Planctomycetota bacterium]|nr:DUF4332 domain-containing protein [Planctomycetaceae bacterium]MDQ3333255.1 DUF4332 domain-containing protein [Planctomycetota bacterium]